MGAASYGAAVAERRAPVQVARKPLHFPPPHPSSSPRHRVADEALNERIGFAVGEILSVIGQWQAEREKQVQDFQEEVIERAKKAKEKAALEVMDEQVVISKSLRAPSDTATPADSPPSPGPKTEDPFQEMLMDKLGLALFSFLYRK